MSSLRARPPVTFALCSAFFSILFAYSALVQLNDDDWAFPRSWILFPPSVKSTDSMWPLGSEIDWYLWLPFYSLACLVCLVHTVRVSTTSRRAAQVGLVFGLLLFIKVVLEACIRDDGFSWMDLVSLDMNQRLVREKLGSLLVCLCLWLELEVSGSAVTTSRNIHPSYNAGIMLLVFVSGCLCAAYFAGKETNS